MANQEQLEILEQGVDIWNKWVLDNFDVVEIDLSGANLYKTDLRGVLFLDANLSDVHIRRANLSDANFTNTVLNYADLRGANLSKANFTSTDLSDAELQWAHLTRTNLFGSRLWGTNLRSAILENTDFENCEMAYVVFVDNDLSSSLNLQTVDHNSPSSIDIDTIQKSKGKIPVEFLRGCGLSDLDIEYAKLAAPGLDPEEVLQITNEIHRLYCDQPLQFYSCFISYNSKDQEFAQRLHDDLQDNGVRCWFAPEDMKIGDQIRPTIDQQIRLRDKLLVILSENSAKSEWVGDEVEAGLEEENASGRLVLFPIRLDDTVMETRDDWAAKIKRRRHIGDFSNWKDEESYRKAFERLLRDLKTMIIP